MKTITNLDCAIVKNALVFIVLKIGGWAPLAPFQTPCLVELAQALKLCCKKRAKAEEMSIPYNIF